MNIQTTVATYVFGLLVVVGIGVVIRTMLRGWSNRAQRQAAIIGQLPPVPDRLGAALIAPTPGLYIGSTLAPNWLDRVTAGDLGYRCRAVLTRYPEGILMERIGATPIWVSVEALGGVRTERALAGKVIPGRAAGQGGGGRLLVIRWRLPSGMVIDTGFRGDNRGDYSGWTTGVAA